MNKYVALNSVDSPSNEAATEDISSATTTSATMMHQNGTIESSESEVDDDDVQSDGGSSDYNAVRYTFNIHFILASRQLN